MGCPLPPETTPMTTPAVRIVVPVELDLASTRQAPPAFDFLHIATKRVDRGDFVSNISTDCGDRSHRQFQSGALQLFKSSELGLTDKYCETGVRLLALAYAVAGMTLRRAQENIGPRNASKDLEPPSLMRPSGTACR